MAYTGIETKNSLTMQYLMRVPTGSPLSHHRSCATDPDQSIHRAPPSLLTHHWHRPSVSKRRTCSPAQLWSQPQAWQRAWQRSASHLTLTSLDVSARGPSAPAGSDSACMYQCTVGVPAQSAAYDSPCCRQQSSYVADSSAPAGPAPFNPPRRVLVQGM